MHVRAIEPSAQGTVCVQHTKRGCQKSALVRDFGGAVAEVCRKRTLRHVLDGRPPRTFVRRHDIRADDALVLRLDHGVLIASHDVEHLLVAL